MPEPLAAKKVEIKGIVQGVGFRPFIFQLASRHHLTGKVSNTAAGVSIHVEGAATDIARFLEDIEKHAPPLSRITEISVESNPVEGFRTFSIAVSQTGLHAATLISPDVSICDDCLKELFDPNDRRFHYPFINCTNCGPRYTIIHRVPYDRPNTSMKKFIMCPECQAEYDDPNNRRFHAQPNACPVCGPEVFLYDASGRKINIGDPITEAATLLKTGHILAVKGLGGFHLAADAENNGAVEGLRGKKHREEKPFALMSGDVATIGTFARMDAGEEKMLTAPTRPIVLLKKQTPNAISDSVCPQNLYFGVMLPYTPLHYLLLSHGFKALVMTSGNQSDEPISIDNADAFKRLGRIADYFLVHDRDIVLRSDDSIARNISGVTRLVRRSRGYVPVPIFLKHRLPQILACGAEMKNTVCLTKDDHAFLSQHIGDLEHPAAHDFFEQTITHMQDILDIRPEIIAHDLHPDYFSTRYAITRNDAVRVPVQHHHAHIVSCMAENRMDGEVIGLAFDGTGFGTDGAIWGGEVILADFGGFKRLAHLEYIPMPGSAAAIREPWRMAISYLLDTFGESFQNLSLPLLNTIDPNAIQTMIQMISKKINSPLTSSLGRLFDAVAAIMGIRNFVSFEGQAAMELEMMAETDRIDMQENKVYGFEWTSGETKRISVRPVILGIITDMSASIPLPLISRRFHATLIQLFSLLCRELRTETGLNRVVLSGGVFQNALLLDGLISALGNEKFEVFTHSLAPANDGGISLGQALIAAKVSEKI
ncbi:MAG: carbamoyltransferase HypF [Desulfosalsimonadaceae bacterium]